MLLRFRDKKITFNVLTKVYRVLQEMTEKKEGTKKASHKLSQMQTVSQARVIFEELAEEAEYDEEAQIHAWLSMMDDDLIQRLYLKDPLPMTISEWKRQVVRMDELRRAVQTEGTDRRFFGN